MVARSACRMLQEMYEGSFLLDGAYANVTLLSRRLTTWAQIGAQMRRMTKRWSRSFFRMEAAVWKEEAYGSDSTVAVHIRHLREKIEITPADPRYLKVVWGQGYKFEKGDRS